MDKINFKSSYNMVKLFITYSFALHFNKKDSWNFYLAKSSQLWQYNHLEGAPLDYISNYKQSKRHQLNQIQALQEIYFSKYTNQHKRIPNWIHRDQTGRVIKWSAAVTAHHY